MKNISEKHWYRNQGVSIGIALKKKLGLVRNDFIFLTGWGRSNESKTTHHEKKNNKMMDFYVSFLCNAVNCVWLSHACLAGYLSIVWMPMMKGCTSGFGGQQNLQRVWALSGVPSLNVKWYSGLMALPWVITGGVGGVRCHARSRQRGAEEERKTQRDRL